MNLQENIDRLKQLIGATSTSLVENKKEITEKLILKNWDKYVELVSQAYLDAPDFEPDVTSHWEILKESNYKLFKRLLSKVDVIFTSENKSEVGSVNILGRKFPIIYLPSSEQYKTQQEMKSDYENTGKLKISIDYSDHPIFSVKDNIVFRTVHDFIVHILGNHGFGAKGEIASYNRHAKLAPPDALPALFTEVVGQACVTIATNSFPKQKITVLKGFDYTQVGKVDDYDVEDKTLTKDGVKFKDQDRKDNLDFKAIAS
jgi:hypothetical protein